MSSWVSSSTNSSTLQFFGLLVYSKQVLHHIPVLLSKDITIVPTVTAFVFAFCSITGMFSLQASVLPDVYAQTSQQDQSNIAAKAAKTAAAADGTLGTMQTRLEQNTQRLKGIRYRVPTPAQ